MMDPRDSAHQPLLHQRSLLLDAQDKKRSDDLDDKILAILDVFKIIVLVNKFKPAQFSAQIQILKPGFDFVLLPGHKYKWIVKNGSNFCSRQYQLYW